MSCSHCGSPIEGKSTFIKTKGGMETMWFHDNPTECYIKDKPVYFHKRQSFVMKEIVLAGFGIID
jgi:hypothetical protein